MAGLIADVLEDRKQIQQDQCILDRKASGRTSSKSCGKDNKEEEAFECCETQASSLGRHNCFVDLGKAVS